MKYFYSCLFVKAARVLFNNNWLIIFFLIQARRCTATRPLPRSRPLRLRRLPEAEERRSIRSPTSSLPHLRRRPLRMVRRVSSVFEEYRTFLSEYLSKMHRKMSNHRPFFCTILGYCGPRTINKGIDSLSLLNWSAVSKDKLKHCYYSLLCLLYAQQHARHAAADATQLLPLRLRHAKRHRRQQSDRNARQTEGECWLWQYDNKKAYKTNLDSK